MYGLRRPHVYSVVGENPLTLFVADVNDKKSNDAAIDTTLKVQQSGDDVAVYLKDKKIVTVWFDAWRYEQEESLPIIALIRNISCHLDPSVNIHPFVQYVHSLGFYQLINPESASYSFPIKDLTLFPHTMIRESSMNYKTRNDSTLISFF
jgi:hypothetical protein